MTYTPFPVWPAPEGSSGGSGGGANEVFFLAGLVAAAAGSTLVQGLTYFVSDVGSGMLALASTDATYAFLGTLALDHDDPVPTGYIGHFTRTPAP